MTTHHVLISSASPDARALLEHLLDAAQAARGLL